MLYPDLRNEIRKGTFISGFEHFVLFGQREGRRSSPLFDESKYLRMNPDVAEAVTSMRFLNGGEHYVLCGHKEGRRSGGFLDFSVCLPGANPSP